MKDIRTIHLNKKAQGFDKIAISIVVVVIVLLISIILYAKFSQSTQSSMLDGGTVFNSSDYCPAGTINGAINCSSATSIPLPAEYTTLQTTRTNALAGFDLASIGPIVLAGVGILGAVSLFGR